MPVPVTGLVMEVCIPFVPQEIVPLAEKPYITCPDEQLELAT